MTAGGAAGSGSGITRARAILILATALAFGCASGGREFEVPLASPYHNSAIEPYDAALRHYVVAGDTAAIDRIQRKGPGDELVRLLNRGLYLHRIGKYQESNVALQRAEQLAEDRYTKSISQNIAAFMLNDRVLDYSPSALERAMIHYYGMINYMVLGNEESAIVEARRANLFLERYNRDNAGARSYTNDAFVEHVAGLLHWSGGDYNDALVSLRKADDAFIQYRARFGIEAPTVFGEDLHMMANLVGVPEIADSAAKRYHLGPGPNAVRAGASGPSGELIVIIENGFVAHRTEDKVFIPILESERDMLRSGEAGHILEATAQVMIRTVGWLNQASREGREQVRQFEGGLLVGSLLLNADLVSFAWPTYLLDANAVRNVTVRAGGDQLQAALVEDLSSIAARDFEERKPGIIARMVARTLFKEFSVDRIEAAGEKAGGVVGGFLARVGARSVATLTERADTRFWSLLPHEIRIARFALPVGEHHISITIEDRGTSEQMDVGTVSIVDGKLSIQTVFVTGNESGNLARFRAATSNVDYRVPPMRN
jgi:hypothetical protein